MAGGWGLGELISERVLDAGRSDKRRGFKLKRLRYCSLEADSKRRELDVRLGRPSEREHVVPQEVRRWTDISLIFSLDYNWCFCTSLVMPPSNYNGSFWRVPYTAFLSTAQQLDVKGASRFS